LRLLVFGAGYTGRAIHAAATAAGHDAVLVSRTPGPGVEAFDRVNVAGAEALVATAAPDGGVDPVLAAHGAALARGRLRHAVYLSTTGVYGDRGGAWVDEATEPLPMQARSRERVAVERAWAALAPEVRVDLCRVAGIYGPGRSAIEELRAGRGRRVDKPGHVFGRIHRDDIAGAVVAALARPPAGVRVLHLADDEPAEPRAVTEEAARLLGVAPPPLVAFTEAAAGMSPMALSFWAECRRVSSAATKAALGISWRYPTYRDGLASVLEESAH
jgi:nucleoside-diphosphate-sugar epimerase